MSARRIRSLAVVLCTQALLTITVFPGPLDDRECLDRDDSFRHNPRTAVFGPSEAESIAVLISVGEGTRALDGFGVQYRPFLGDFCSVYMSLNQFWELSLKHSDVSAYPLPRVEPELDVSSVVIKAPTTRENYAVDGSGVVIGVVDNGFQIDSDDFKFASDSTKIMFYWDQRDDSTGSSPIGYNYGREWTRSEINAGNWTCCGELHGTHVAGIASGTGRSTGAGIPESTFVGVAPGSDLILVRHRGDSKSMVDGLEYIRSKASDSTMPCVVNLSLESGWPDGPHDGWAWEEMKIDSLLEQQGPRPFLIVKSAGNEGYIYGNSEVNYHYGYRKAKRNHVSGSGPGYFNVDIPARSWPAMNEHCYISIWYDEGDTCEITVCSPDTCWNPIPSGCSTWYPSQLGPCYFTKIQNLGLLIVNNDVFQDSCFWDHFPADPDREALIHLWEDTVGGVYYPLDSGQWVVELSEIAGDWDAYIYDSKFLPSIIDPHYYNSATVTEARYDNTEKVTPPGNSHHIITVGAFNTKNSWLTGDSLLSPDNYSDLLGSVPAFAKFGYLPIGQKCFFTSEGPTRDQRPKPDIYAPGAYIASTPAVALYPSSDTALAYQYAYDSTHLHMSGTSMAAPHVTGALALLLEFLEAKGDTTLTPEEARILLGLTSDTYGTLNVQNLLMTA